GIHSHGSNRQLRGHGQKGAGERKGDSGAEPLSRASRDRALVVVCACKECIAPRAAVRIVGRAPPPEMTARFRAQKLRLRSYRPVIVAMIAVGMVQVAGHQVVQVIPMGNLLMAAGRTVAMGLLMPGTGVLGSAGSRVGRIDLQKVLIDVVAVNVVQVAIMQ